MDLEQFGQFKNGILLPIQVGERQSWAFVPAAIPPNWKPSENLWPRVVTARGTIAELNGIASSLPKPRILLGSLGRREAIKSSTIEDTTVSPEVLLRYEGCPPDTRNRTEKADEAREVHNCHEALRVGRERIRKRPLDLDLICELHRILLGGTRMEQKGPGQFRQKQVFVGKRYTPPPSRELRACLANFEEYLLQPANSPDPLIRAFIAHYQFEAIHPFEDGNGRIGRILLTLMICRDLRLSEPWINLSSFFERHRREYYDKLLTVSTHGDWDEWIGFCLEGATSEAESATAIALRLSELRTALQETHEKLTPRAFEIIDHLFEFPVIDVMGLAAALGVAYNTARADIDKFVKAGILTEAKRSHPREYRADQIMRIAFPADD